MNHSTSMVGTKYTSRWMADIYYRLHGNTLNHPEKFIGRGEGMVIKTKPLMSSPDPTNVLVEGGLLSLGHLPHLDT